MEDFKAKTMELIKQLASSEEDVAFWQKIFSQSKQEDMQQVFKEFQLMSSPQDFNTFTDIWKRMRQAVLEEDEAMLDKALEDEKEFVMKRLDKHYEAELAATDRRIKDILNS